MRRAAIPTVLVVLGAMALPGATVAASHGHKHGRCRRGAVRHAGTCGRRLGRASRPPARQPALAPIVRVAAINAPRRGTRHHVSAAMARVALKKLGGLDALATAIARLNPGSPAGAHALARVADAGGVPVSAGGWSGKATGDVPLHDDSTGADVTVHVDVDRKDGTKAQSTEIRQELVDNCPDGSGGVPGSARHAWSLRLHVAGTKPGWTVEVNFSYDAKFSLLGHTSPDGTLHDWEQSMDFLTTVQFAVLDHGKVVQTNPPTVWTTHASADLRPGERTTPGAVFDSFDGPGVFGFLGKRYVTSAYEDAVGHVVALADFLWVQVANETDHGFADAKAHHWDTGDCVKVALSDPIQQLAPAQSTAVTERLSGPAGKGVAPATLTARAGQGAVVSPPSTAADASPLHFTAIAPSSFAAGDTFTVTVDAVSRQGRGSAEITFSALPRTKFYFRTSAVSGSMDYEAHYPRNSFGGDTCMISGSEKYALTTSQIGTGQPTDGSSDQSGGFVDAPAHQRGTVDYSDPCNFPTASEDPCHADLDNETGVALFIFHADGAPTATVQMNAFGRDLEGDIYCHDRFADDWAHGDDSQLNAIVPWSELVGSAPFTITASDDIADGDRTVSRRISITLRPVDENGNPLPS
jgi:hypothetical protein